MFRYKCWTCWYTPYIRAYFSYNAVSPLVTAVAAYSTHRYLHNTHSSTYLSLISWLRTTEEKNVQNIHLYYPFKRKRTLPPFAILFFSPYIRWLCKKFFNSTLPEWSKKKFTVEAICQSVKISSWHYGIMKPWFISYSKGVRSREIATPAWVDVTLQNRQP